MNRRHSARGLRFLVSLAVIATVAVCCFIISASAADTGVDNSVPYVYDVKGQTLCEAFEMDPDVYSDWLLSHEFDNYYFGTPYLSNDHRSPNGDCWNAYGVEDVPGVAGCNCTGFVWHVLYSATKRSYGYTGRVPAMTGWYSFYSSHQITRRAFRTKADLLKSGYLEKGDILWMFEGTETQPKESNHIAVYWGDGHSDRLWDSLPGGNKYRTIAGWKYDGYIYVVLKTGNRKILDTPTIKRVDNAYSGARVVWKSVRNAEQYRVFVKSGNGWKRLGETDKCYFLHKDAKSGKKYTYTVRCISKDGKENLSGYDKKGITNTFIASPRVTKFESLNSGLKLTWSKSAGAARYAVFRKNGDTWKGVAVTAKNYCVDTHAKPGVKYTYTVRCMTKTGKTYTSWYNEKGFSSTYVAAPTVTSLTSTASGMKVMWVKPKGSYKYAVFRKTAGSDWKGLGITIQKYFYDKTAKSGTKYTYTVRAVAKDNKTWVSDFNRKGYSGVFIAAPVITKADVNKDGIDLAWKKSAGAPKYCVFRKNGESWKKLGVTAENTFTDKNATPGSSYTYTVRCVASDEMTWLSAFKPVSLFFAETPQPNAFNAATGVRITWPNVAGASKYAVFLKNGSKWQKLGETTNTAFNYNETESGESYTFTVVCINALGNRSSGYSSVGATTVFVAPPDGLNYRFLDNGVSLSWTAVSGAEKYRLYRTAGGATEALVTTTETAFDDTGLENGTEYSYTVRCLDGDGNLVSANSASLTLTYIDAEDPYEAIERLVSDEELRNRLNGKRILVFGDGIMSVEGSENEGLAELIAERFGMTVTDRSVPEATVVPTEEGSSLSAQILSAINREDKADLILIGGMVNDFGHALVGTVSTDSVPEGFDRGTYAGELEYAFCLLKEYYPETPVIFVRPHNIGSVDDSLEKSFGAAALKACVKWSVPYADIYSETGFDTSVQTLRDRYTVFSDALGRHDGVHPNKDGYLRFYFPLTVEVIGDSLK